MTTGLKPLRGPLRKRESHLWERDPHDWYCEPAWTSERLFEMETFSGPVWDPACGIGTIPKSATAAGLHTNASDLIDRGYGYQLDFLSSDDRFANIVSNPPFGIAEKFVSLALAIATHKVAMLLPANWVQGDKRSRWLEITPLRRVLFITPRPSMPPGAAIAAGQRPGNGTTDYAWFIWDRSFHGKTEIGWLRRDSGRMAA